MKPIKKMICDIMFCKNSRIKSKINTCGLSFFDYSRFNVLYNFKTLTENTILNKLKLHYYRNLLNKIIQYKI